MESDWEQEGLMEEMGVAVEVARCDISLLKAYWLQQRAQVAREAAEHPMGAEEWNGG